MKLPEPLSSIIHKKYKEQVITQQLDNIATKIKLWAGPHGSVVWCGFLSSETWGIGLKVIHS